MPLPRPFTFPVATTDPVTGDPGHLPVHVLLGGNGINAMEDALQSDAASRILLHCCTARDSVYVLDLPLVFGLFSPASTYTDTLVRTMAFSGINRLAVVGTSNSALHLQLCAGAVRQVPTLAKLRPGFGVVAVINYTAAEAATAGFWDDAASRVHKAGADALLACDEPAASAQLVRRLADMGHRLSALWLVSYGNVTELREHLGEAAEFALTTMQWSRSLPFADPAFGTAEEFAAAFQAATSLEPSYFAAAAAATGHVLKTALTQAVSLCNVSLPAGADPGDAFMWQAGVLACAGQSRNILFRSETGQELLRDVLALIRLDTFFGPVGFNAYRQNIYHPTIVAQVMGDRLQVVVPLDLAEARLVLPIPAPQSPRGAWAGSAAGIVIITLACCLAAACLGLAMVLAHRWLRPRLNWHALEVEVKAVDIQVDLPPFRQPDGTFEAGEGTYRGTRVKLEVAAELLAPLMPGAVTSWMGPGSKAPSPLPAALQHQRSRFNLEAGNANGAVPIDESCIAPQMRPSLRDLFTRRSSEPLDASMTPRSGKSQASLALSPIKRSRRQISVLVWRLLRMRHPAICPVIGIVWEWPGLTDNGAPVPVIVRQWYELGNLANILDNETVPLPLLTKASIMEGVAEGLAYLHAQEPPVCAGPLNAQRVLLDKNFNPHIFLRITSLDPAAAAASAFPAATGATDSGYGAGTGAAWAAPSVPVVPPPPARSGRSRCVSTSGGGGLAQLVNVSHMRSPQRTQAKPPHVVLVDGGGAECDPATAGGMPDIERPSLRAGNDLAGLPVSSGAGAATPYMPFVPYVPSQAQDMLEFGRLLGHVFVSTQDGNSSNKLPSLPGRADSDDLRRHGSGGLGLALAYRERSMAALAFVDEVALREQDAAMLEALEGVCPPLAALARRCMAPDPQQRPRAGEVLAELGGAVRRALTHGLVHAAPASPGAKSAKDMVLGAVPSSPLGGGDSMLSNLVCVREGSFVAMGGAAAAAARRRSLMLGAPPVLGPHGLQAGGSVRRRVLQGNIGAGAGPGGEELAPHRQPEHAGAPRLMGHMVAADDLLYDIFPPKVANALRAGETVQPERYECVSIFFSDIVGYTDLCAQLQPHEVMDLMHRLYSLFDGLCQALELFKVETVGDAYLAVGNLRWPQPDCHARLITQFALDAIRGANSLPVHPERPELGCVRIRVGLHCGPVVGSVVGTLNRRFCLFGDAVNTAARMEHNSEADRVHCSAAFAALVAEQWPDVLVISRGLRHIKGKGQLETFWLEEKQPEAHLPGTLDSGCGPTAALTGTSYCG
ncbi:hypothetical protein GPECTOR_19g290 [Gonium pectorale]|uniref:Guanylate cyclase domain-containing protein n=1 Tax=Gonium pectorale TaxID=33097 RepID=A0A150GJ70_GONPE|nr:hypothetical protein GPECTOR_19g290 [Gonium pectorale]|eukprot:KXZ49839.1 hypothetical protein GPECTOR_19g290 [Gonium pectorale]